MQRPFNPTLFSLTGLHSGPVVSGIVGKIRRRFCVFGNTVNMASRTETSCPPGCIQATGVTYHLAAPHLNPDEFVFEDRGDVEVKGSSDPIQMFLAKRPGGSGAGSLLSSGKAELGSSMYSMGTLLAMEEEMEAAICRRGSVITQGLMGWFGSAAKLHDLQYGGKH